MNNNELNIYEYKEMLERVKKDESEVIELPSLKEIQEMEKSIYIIYKKIINNLKNINPSLDFAMPDSILHRKEEKDEKGHYTAYYWSLNEISKKVSIFLTHLDYVNNYQKIKNIIYHTFNTMPKNTKIISKVRIYDDVTVVSIPYTHYLFFYFFFLFFYFF